jgi:hypothetical protein
VCHCCCLPGCWARLRLFRGKQSAPATSSFVCNVAQSRFATSHRTLGLLAVHAFRLCTAGGPWCSYRCSACALVVPRATPCCIHVRRAAFLLRFTGLWLLAKQSVWALSIQTGLGWILSHGMSSPGSRETVGESRRKGTALVLATL